MGISIEEVISYLELTPVFVSESTVTAGSGKLFDEASSIVVDDGFAGDILHQPLFCQLHLRKACAE